MKKIYLDYAGTTPMDSRVERVVLSRLKNSWGNASSIHETGRHAKKVIENSRKDVAKVIGSKPDEIIFTGSGTESDNLAIFGIARAYKSVGRHIITSKIEHPAVLRACEYLQKHEKFSVTYLDVERDGIVDPTKVAKSLQPGTILVSIMYANNEIGTIQLIREISKIVADFRSKKLNAGRQGFGADGKFPFFHSDACQAAGALDLNVRRLGVDSMTLNGSKIYGPKAVGCLYLRHGVDLTPLIVGGSQERGMRAGTENPALIAGFTKALELADAVKIKENARLGGLRDYMIDWILKNISGSHLNGDINRRLPNNVNISFEDIDGEMLMLALDQEGVQVSTGSACASTSSEPSHVMRAIGLTGDSAKGNIRITLGRSTTKKDLKQVLAILSRIIKKLRC